MSNYLEIRVPLRQNAEWFVKLREATEAAHIPVRWQRCGTHHITVTFINGDEQVDALTAAFERCLNGSEAPLLTFDKIDVFKANNRSEFIVNLTSSQPSPEFTDFVRLLRQTVLDLGAEIESDFRLHVTLGKIDANAVTLDGVKRVADSIQVPPFTLQLTDAEYRYFRGETIRRWNMQELLTQKQNNMIDYKEINYKEINRIVMQDTVLRIKYSPELQSAVDYSVAHQFMVAQEENTDQPAVTNSQTQYIASSKPSFEAAKAYKGKKIAVLNFANRHAIGGAPFSAGAQEESLCRCSTLYPCLKAMSAQFYEKHISEYNDGKIDNMGNDDLIYTPDVVVFKTDERTDPIYPRMMEKNEWYKVDVITCAAPELRHHDRFPENYEEIIRSRIKKILDVAAKEKVEVLILGAWGCGAFENDIQVVSNAFYDLLKNYNFEMVEFALGSTGSISSFFPRYQN